MPAATPSSRAQRPLDAVALAQVLRRLQRTPSAPWLHAEVARRMGERLAVIRLQPSVLVDWCSHLGASAAILQRAYPSAACVRVEPDRERRSLAAAAVAAPPRRWWTLPGSLARNRPPVHVVGEDGLSPAAGQLLWANMVLHGALDPQAVMQQWQRALAVDGFLMFSTLGPGTLQGLRNLYRAQGWPVPHAPFVDMHDLGDMLVEAGFADPVMDQETLTLTWPSAQAALTELRQLGGNVDPRRFAGLRTPRWHARLLALLAAPGPASDATGRVTLDFEIVYGHAFKPVPRARLAAETAVPLDDLRAMVRAGRNRP